MRTRTFHEFVIRQDRLAEFNWPSWMQWGGQQKQQTPQTQTGGQIDPSTLNLQMRNPNAPVPGQLQMTPQGQGQDLNMQGLNQLPQSQGQNLPLQQTPQGQGKDLNLQFAKPDAKANQGVIDAIKFYSTNKTIQNLMQTDPKVKAGWQKFSQGWNEFKTASKAAIAARQGGQQARPGQAQTPATNPMQLQPETDWGKAANARATR